MMSVSNPLRYRRQFILGPRPLQEYAPWPQVQVSDGLVAQVHPDLPVVQVQRGPLKITLLGFIIDPAAPELDDAGVLRELAGAASTSDELPAHATDLGGRFVLVVDDGTQTLLLHDPCGLREVFHNAKEGGEVWCASQPCRIADALGYQPGAEAREFMGSDYYRNHHEPWWPGPGTPYAELRRLQPNHLLDLRSGETRRYWPNRQLRRVDPEDAAQITAQLLRGSVRAASRRFRLSVPLTAGMDSRTVLAATRGLDDLYHYTLRHSGIERGSADLVVPGRILSRLGREHHVIGCPDRMSEEFASVYRTNVSCTHASAGAMAEGLLEHYPRSRVMLSGHCSEIARDTFRISHTPAPDAAALARLMGMSDNPTALRHFDAWLSSTGPVADSLGYRVWDLFFWEQEYGTWAANGQSQWDLVHERFTPFNQRTILSTLLGTDPFFRQQPRYELHRRIMQILWPELLAEPFNPVDRSIRTRMRAALGKIRPGSGVVQALRVPASAMLFYR